MESNLKHKKHLEESLRKGIKTIPQPISLPTPSPRVSSPKRSTKQIPKTTQKSSWHVTNRVPPNLPQKASPIQSSKPTAKSNVGTVPVKKICSKPSLNVSVKNRKSRKAFKRACRTPKKETPEQPLKFSSGSLLSKKSSSRASLSVYSKKFKNKSNKGVKSILKTYNWKDMKILKEDCLRIQTVFENRKSRDRASRMSNLDILGRLYLLVSCGMEMKPRERVVRYIINYMCEHNHLLSELVFIISDTEDLQTCLYAIKVLYQLVIKGSALDEKSKSAMRKVLSASTLFETITESMYYIHTRFFSNIEYKQEFQNVHSQLLQMVVVLCRTSSCRKQLRHASDGTVRLISKLTVMCTTNKELANSILEALKVLCSKKKNCDILATKRFFDGLWNCYRLSQKLLSLPVILKMMSRHKLPMICMSSNEKIFGAILDLICYTGKKSINKQALLATLFRITSNELGLRILTRNEMFYKLYHYFLKNEKNSNLNYRLGTIRVYTILNRSVHRVVLPSQQLVIDLRLPEDVKKRIEEENVSDESEPENDESDEGSRDDEDDDSDEFELEIPGTGGLKRPEKSKAQEASSEDPLTDMNCFYVEYLLNYEKTDYPNFSSFNLYNSIDKLDNTKAIEVCVHRNEHMDRHAYPDAAMLEPQADEHLLNPSVNNFSIDFLAHKLKIAKGLNVSLFCSEVVYDLDELCKDFRKPAFIPNPWWLAPPKMYDQTISNFPSKNSLKFESRFECGNLRKAVQIEQYEYELFLSPDTSTTKGLRWFYFQVTNMVSEVPYIFNIMNFLRFSSQYNYGMQPLMFSVTDYTLHRTGWKRIGEQVVYYGNHYVDESEINQYMTLSFTVNFRYSNDYVYFAYHYPYTYTRLMTKLFPLTKYKSEEIYVRMDKLCNSVSTENEIALLTITGAWNRPSTLGIPLRKRPVIFITARVHPGETNASWIMEGIISFLLDETDQNAIAAREHFIFKIIPMLNPEGVIYGNNRNGLTGADLNRCWAKPSKTTCPEIYYSKRLIACAKKELQLPIAAYIDIHGHSRKKYFFFYGCNPKMSWNKEDKVHGNLLETLKLLPDMVHDINPNIKLSQCKYKVIKSRESTGRVVMWREFDIKHSYTLECSFSFASEKQSVNTKILSDIGASVVASLGKIADKAYTSKRVLSSFSLDFSSVDMTKSDKRSTVENILKEVEEAKRSLFLSRSVLSNPQESSPLFVSSRALEKTIYKHSEE